MLPISVSITRRLNGVDFSVKKNFFWNMFGMGGPMLVAVVAIPYLLARYGDERFGVLSIVFALIGYLSIFDFGLGRAVTKLMSEALHHEQKHEAESLFLTAVSLALVFGLIAAVGCFGLADWLIYSVLKINAAYTSDAVKAIWVLGLGMPAVVISSILIGGLESIEKFKDINLVRLFIGGGNFLVPVATLRWSDDIATAAIGLVVLRWVSLGMFLHFVVKANQFNGRQGEVGILYARKLFNYGVWITVSSIVSPLMVQLDRFVIGSMVGVGSLSSYVVPVDVLNRLSVIPGAFINGFFPKLVVALAKEKKGGEFLYTKYRNRLDVFMLAGGLAGYLLASPVFQLWLGTEFWNKSADVVKILIVGAIYNFMARMPYAYLQAGGKPRLTAAANFIELPIYLILMWYLIGRFGLMGAALSWSMRMMLDYFLLSYWVNRDINESGKQMVYSLGVGLGMLVPFVFFEVVCR